MADIHTAWGIIANVNNGDWTQQSREWQEAASRWRDLVFHAHYCDIDRASEAEAGGEEDPVVHPQPLSRHTVQAQVTYVQGRPKIHYDSLPEDEDPSRG